MYYLNDKHPEYQYTVYCRIRNACPYTTNLFNDKKQLMQWLEDITKWHNRYHQTFYIDYSEYKNEYSEAESERYYKILVRKVNDWKELK